MADSPDRDQAYKFLDGLKRHLEQGVRPSSDIRDWLAEEKRNAPPGKDLDYENRFVKKFILPKVSSYLQLVLGAPEKACKAFLTEAESPKKEKIASGSPASQNRHLFTKLLGVTSASVVKLWWDKRQKFPMAQSCPDWAFREPCPYKVVFEAKLFRDGGIEKAKTQLVQGVYQCMFYRGQPAAPRTATHTEWDYEFACLMAYDVSEQQSLVKAWDSVREEVSEGCWDSANIFVLVLPRLQ